LYENNLFHLSLRDSVAAKPALRPQHSILSISLATRSAHREAYVGDLLTHFS